MRKRQENEDRQPEGPHPLRPGMPTRLLPHAWPFLYSVLPNGDLVVNKRLPPAQPPKRPRRQLLQALGDAPF